LFSTKLLEDLLPTLPSTESGAAGVNQAKAQKSQRNGIIKVKTSTELDANMPIEELTGFTDNYNSTSTLIEKRTVLTNSLNSMSDNLASQVPTNQDKQTVKIGFVTDLIKNLIKSIANVVLTPKVIIIFLINFKIVFGVDAEYANAKDFIQKNRVLFKEMFKNITEIIVKLLMSYAMKEVTRLAGEAAAAKVIEKTLNRKQQLLSLVGVPQEALRKIKGLI
jgi:hypothetical protein